MITLEHPVAGTIRPDYRGKVRVWILALDPDYDGNALVVTRDEPAAGGGGFASRGTFLSWRTRDVLVDVDALEAALVAAAAR